jgi:cell fate regulator YaaT (PSP1 superfamily)
MADATAIKLKQAKNKKYMLVSYGRMNTLSWFEHHETNIPKLPSRVVVKTDRGLELGHIVGQSCPYRGGQFRLSRDQIKKYFNDSEIDLVVEEAGKFIRYATADDISEEKHLRKISEEELKCCRRFVKELNLSMKIVDAEHIFGGERLIFYFMSDGRVDFRELVKKIAREHQTRIEMRQIGSRDEAKLLGDIESCGQECCCIRFLKALKPVNMRMAKMQKATLDPSKISGYCGRLKCCLRYEDKTYTELKRSLPRKNTVVKTKHGQGKVIDTQILTQLVMIEHDDGTKIAVPVEELEEISSLAVEKETQDDTQNDEIRDDRESGKQ